MEYEEEWIEIYEFPGYSVSSLGQIRNDLTGRILKQSPTIRGSLKVGLIRDGIQYTKGVSALVAEAFLPKPENPLFDTPINKDTNKANNQVYNLEWRPRWYAIKYSRQFKERYQHQYTGPILDCETGDRYETVEHASIVNGLLFKDVFLGCLSQEPVFPTWQTFEWLH
jgi:hypothetical protein